jgi:hypothetical protein
MSLIVDWLMPPCTEVVEQHFCVKFILAKRLYFNVSEPSVILNPTFTTFHLILGSEGLTILSPLEFGTETERKKYDITISAPRTMPNPAKKMTTATLEIVFEIASMFWSNVVMFAAVTELTKRAVIREPLIRYGGSPK